jgi:hypothetical protein
MEWWQIQELMITGAVIMGVIIPVFAFTYKFLAKPSWGDRKRLRGERDPSVEAVRDARLDNMERQLEQLEASPEEGG